MTRVKINIYNKGEYIYDLEEYSIAKVDTVLLLVLKLNCNTIIYEFFTDRVVKSFDVIEETINSELSKDEAFFDEYIPRNYITVGNNRFTGIRIDTII